MKKNFIMMAFVALMLPLTARAQQLADYTVSVGSETYSSIASAGHLLSSVNGDYGSQTLTMPFAFPFGESTIAQGTNVTVRADGYLYFGTSNPGYNAGSGWNSSYYNYQLISPMVAVDGQVVANGDVSGVYWLDTVDANGDSVLIVEWKGVSHYTIASATGDLNYQLRIYPNGSVTTVYNTSTAETMGSAKHNFFMINGIGDNVCLTGSWASPVMGSPATLPDLGSPLPEAGTTITYSRPTSYCARVSNLAISAITSSGATLSWTGHDNAVGYAIAYGDFTDETTDLTYTLTDLDPSTAYTVSVRAICGANDTSAVSSASFFTTCVTISTSDSAYNEGFEGWSTASSQFNPCWDRLYADRTYGSYNSTSTNYMPAVSAVRAHSGDQSLRMQSQYEYDSYDDYEYDDASLAFMPLFESDVRSLSLSFWYKAASNAASVRLAVGVSSTTSDTSTFSRLVTIAPADTEWHQYEVDLLAYSGTGSRITFFQYSNSETYNTIYGYIDDIHVEELGDCFRPASVSVSNLTATSATISWEELNSVGTYRVVLGDDETNAFIVSDDTSTTLELEANTEYTVHVSTLCNGEYTEARSLTFRTPCSPVASDELPWTETFDSVSTPSSMPIEVPCMTFNTYRSYYNYPYAASNIYYGASGKSLYFYASAGYTPQVAVLPLFESELNTLQLSFYSRVSSTSNGFEVGTMTNPSDPTTFVPFDTTTTTVASTWEYQEVSFANYEGTGNYIAIRPLLFSGNTLYLDNLTVNTISECARVNAVAVDSISAHYMHLTITDTLEQYSYRVEVIGGGDTISEYLYTTEFIIDTLDAATTYTVNVYTVCSDATTVPVSAVFTTPCEAMPMPFIEDFDAISAVSDLNCWNFYNGLYNDSTHSATLTNSSNWNRHSTAMGGSQHVKLNVYGTTCKYWMVTPEIAINSSNAMLSFDYSLTAFNNANAPAVTNVADDRFLVLATTNGGSIWTVLAAWDSVASHNSYAAITNAIQSASIELGQYDGQNIRIAFYGESTVSGGDNDLHIDNIVVESMDCMPPTAPVLASVGENEATLQWHGEEGTFAYRYAPAADTSSWTTGSTNDTTVTITGLSSNTEYTFQVQTDCGSDVTSRWMSISFRTACGAITALPWSENFDSIATGILTEPCWINEHISGAGTNRFSVTTNSYSGGNLTRMLYLPDMSNGTMTKLVLPLMTLPEDQNYLFSIDVYRNASGSSSPNEGVRVYASNSPNIEGATELGFLYRNFTQTDGGVVTTESASGWYTYEFPIPVSGNCYIILRGESTYGSATYMDNLTVMEVPACRRPSTVIVSNVTTSSATLAIDDVNEINHYYVVLGTDSVEVNGNTYTINGLDAATNYTVRVYTVCESGSLAEGYTTATFTTPCSSYSIPYTTSFENDATSTTPGCWINLNGTTNVLSSTSNSHTGSLYLHFSGSLRNMIAMPQFTEEISGLQVRFWTRPESTGNSNCGTLHVGYLTSLGDTSSFVSVASYNYNDFSGYEEKEVPMTGAPAGSVIAFLHAANATSWYWFIDDVTVEPVSTCARPQSVSVDNVAATTATLHVQDTNEANNYVYRLYANGSMVDSVVFTGNVANLSGLDPSTSYEVTVATVCSGELSNLMSTTFFTSCVSITALPWNEDFEAWATGADNVSPCWDRIYSSAFGTLSVTNYPYATTSAARNGSNGLQFYSAYDSDYGNGYSAALLPEFAAPVNTLSLSFWHKLSSGYDSSYVELVVGVSSTTADTTGFTRVATFVPSTSWQQYTVDLSAYSGTGDRIVILQKSIDGDENYEDWDIYYSSNANGYIDDITVSLADTTAPQPTMYTVTATSADVTMGTATVTPSGSVVEGTIVTATATANDGYHFVNWTAAGNAVSTANPYTFTVSADIALTATFASNGTEPEECVAPSNVTASDVTSSSATISWTAGGSETQWMIDYNGQTVTTTTNPYTLTGLTAGTTYTVSVKALCGDGNESEWSNATTFTTTTVGIDDVASANINLYPNPATTSVTLTGFAGQAKVTVVDMNGRTVGEYTANDNTLTIDVTALAQGAYFVRVTGEQQTAIRKLIVK